MHRHSRCACKHTHIHVHAHTRTHLLEQHVLHHHAAHAKAELLAHHAKGPPVRVKEGVSVCVLVSGGVVAGKGEWSHM